MAADVSVNKGILDLRGKDLDKIKEIEFNGDWEFYWNQLLGPSDFKKYHSDTIKYIHVPSVWTSYKIDNKKLPAFGCATYRMQILVDSTIRTLAFKLGGMGTACRLYVDGKMIYKAGEVSKTKNGAIPGYEPGVLEFRHKTDTVEVIFQVSNFNYSKGGIWNNFNKLGKPKYMYKSWDRTTHFSLLLIGCFLIFAFYHLGLYFLNRNFRYTLYFSLFCIDIIFRALVVNGIYLIYLFPNFSWNTLIKIEYFTLIGGTITFSLFIYKFFIEEYSTNFLKLIIATSTILGTVILFSEPAFFTRYLIIYQLNIILASVYIVITVVRAVLNKKNSALILLIGFIFLLTCIVNDILYTNKLIDTMYLTSIGLLIFIFSQGYMLASHFSSLYLKADQLAQRLETTNINLEKLVDKRTSKILEQNKLLQTQSREILQKNEELEQVNDEIMAQRDNLKLQNQTVVSQKKQITSSIEYASRIQGAVLDSANLIEEISPENFILFHPKDIVSGDFYWFKNIKIGGRDLKIVAVVDCTGHGVPGAFMSILGALFLNNITGEKLEKIDASVILNKLRLEVKQLFQQDSSGNSVKDGMDLTLGIIDTQEMKMYFAGAHNSIYIIRNKNGQPASTIEEYKGDNMPIGIYVKEKESFTNHEIPIHKGDLIYFFTDGFYDQFGGTHGEKLKKVNFKRLLLENAHLPLARQKLILERKFLSWMGNFEQIDDITVVGIKI